MYVVLQFLKLTEKTCSIGWDYFWQQERSHEEWLEPEGYLLFNKKVCGFRVDLAAQCIPMTQALPTLPLAHFQCSRQSLLLVTRWLLCLQPPHLPRKGWAVKEISLYTFHLSFCKASKQTFLLVSPVRIR